ncbi:MAG: hypothetical protein CL678_02335 [Bdellovibrionaceae bacterium]|nr:hypothetical protein [Halobacteriovorax sp.]MBN20098.1 hypothetical protein [Pseudobdellovibrionaceae bacterium]
MAKPVVFFIFIILSVITVVVASRRNTTTLPEGRYEIVETGCLKNGKHEVMGDDVYSYYQSVNTPFYAISFLDFDDLQSRQIEVGPSVLKLSIDTKSCQVEYLYDVKFHQHGNLWLEDKKIFHLEPNNCHLSKNIFETDFSYDQEFFIREGAIFEINKPEKVRLEIGQLEGSYFLFLNSSEAHDFDEEEEEKNDKSKFEYLNDFENDFKFGACPPDYTISWKLKKIKDK